MGAKGVIVEVHHDLDEPTPELLDALKRRMFLRNVRVGLIMTPTHTVVLRDTLSSMDVHKNHYEQDSLKTVDLFDAARVGKVKPTADAFLQQVLAMLMAIGSSWLTYLHRSAVSSMVPEVIGSLVQAELEVSEGLLTQDSAAELADEARCLLRDELDSWLGLPSSRAS